MNQWFVFYSTTMYGFLATVSTGIAFKEYDGGNFENVSEWNKIILYMLLILTNWIKKMWTNYIPTYPFLNMKSETHIFFLHLVNKITSFTEFMLKTSLSCNSVSLRGLPTDHPTPWKINDVNKQMKNVAWWHKTTWTLVSLAKKNP